MKLEQKTISNINFYSSVSGIEQRLVALNIGLVAFLPIPLRSFIKQMNDLFQIYMTIVSPKTFIWQNLSGISSAYKPITKNAFNTINSWFTEQKKYSKSGCCIWLKDGAAITDAGDNLFDFYGRDLSYNKGDSNFLVILFPARILEIIPSNEFISQIHKMLDSIPYHSAYLGYTLGMSTLFNFVPYMHLIESHIYNLTQQYRGLEIFKPHLENYEMKLKLRPPSWVTFLSNSFVENLGGLDIFRQNLGIGDFSFGKTKHGISIRTGNIPMLNNVVPEQKVLAKSLFPCFSKQPAYLFSEHPHNDTLDYLRRHL